MSNKRAPQSLNRRILKTEMLEDRLALSGTGLGASDNDFAVDGSRGEKMGFAPLEDRSLDPLDSSNDPDWDFLAARMDEVFNLQSKPDSKFTIYIDYDGHVTENAQWNNGYGIETIVHPPYDVDGNDSFFSATELSRMENGWKRTAEDFAAFDVNVTTIDPGVEALVKSSDSDPEWGIRVVATRDSFADCGCGGHAYINSFNYATDTAALVYNRGDGALGETISHEVGHAINLSHDGLPGDTYYDGHGSGSTSWGAIMGAPFNEEITQWDRAEFFSASNFGPSANYDNGSEDLNVITTENGFGYRVDDHGDTFESATELDVLSSTTLSGFGIIERNTDVDYFSFQHAGGAVALRADALDTRPNLDIWMGLYDADGDFMAQSNPPSSQDAVWSTGNLPAGTYHVKIEGVGSHGVYNSVTDSVQDPANPPWQSSSPEGYSDYGSLGQYWISGSIQSPANTLRVDVDSLIEEGDSATVTFTRTGDITGVASVDFRFDPVMPVDIGGTYPDTIDESDFAGPAIQTVVFAAGQSTVSVLVPSVEDSTFEPDEQFAVRMSNASSGWSMAHSVAKGTLVTDESRVALKPSLGSEFVQVEGDAFAAGSVFRWRQVRFSSDDSDVWGLDNVMLSNSTFSDDLQDGVDMTQWGRIQNGLINDTFSGGSTSLYFTGGGTRAATTRILDPAVGDVLSFDLIFGNGNNGGENADAGEDVALEYSTDNGSTWREIAIYDTEDYTSWQRVNVPLPSSIETEDTTQFSFEVERTGDLSEAATVNWQFTGAGISNPTSSNDFVGGQFPVGQLTFAPMEMSRQITIDIQRDSIVESDERFGIRLVSASSAGPIEVAPGFTQAQGLIRDDDSAADLKMSTQFRWIQDPSASGGDSDVWGLDNIEIASAGLSDDFDPTVDNTQWETITGSVANIFVGGAGNEMLMDGSHPRQAVTRTVEAASGDTIDFDLIIGNNTNGGENANGGEDIYFEMSLNQGNDWLRLNTFDTEEFGDWTSLSEPLPEGAVADVTDQFEGDAGESIYSITLFRTGDVEKFLLVDWQVDGTGANPASAADFAGGVLPFGTAEFKPGSFTATIEVAVASDSIGEADETFAVSLTGSSGGTVSAAEVVATIRNDDTATLGDFDQDGAFGCDDIDLLVAAISSGNNDLALDMNGDGQLDLADVDVWLDVAGTINIGSAYLVGDANLDGVVDVSDFSVWNSHKFTNATGWCVGDFNADGAVDVSDFNRWNGNRFQASGRAANGESSTDERDGDRFVTRDSVTFRWSIETSREDQANHESRYKRIDAVFRGDFDR